MKLIDLLQADRARIIAAYQAELAAGQTLEALAATMQQFFSGIVAAVAESAEPSSSTSVGAREAALVGNSASIILLRTRVGQLARRSRAPVLIVGDRGVGKRHCARVLHQATYPGGLWFELLAQGSASELERCLALLRRRASAEAELGMTVYAHELADAEPEIQAQLSRLLDEQSLPLRVIASSTLPIAALARNGKLRKDLVFRFSNELKLPPLSSRKEDIGPLARHFAELAVLGGATGAVSFTTQAVASLCEYSWPGNVREVRELIERLVADSGTAVLDAADIPTLGDRPSGIVIKLPPSGIAFADLERQLLVQALALAENNQTKAASLLGLTRDQIRYRMAKFELPLSARAE